MIIDEDRRIIEQEIDRLELGYRNAQERYGSTGSPSSDRTMHKYDVLKTALENYLYDRDKDSTRKSMLRYQDQLVRAHRMVEDSFRRGKIAEAAYVELVRILMEG